MGALVSAEMQARTCARVTKNFRGQALMRVNDRLERRLGFRCAAQTQLTINTVNMEPEPASPSRLGQSGAISQAELYMRRILTKGTWSRKVNDRGDHDIFDFELSPNMYTFSVVNSDQGVGAEAGRWFLEQQDDEMHLLLEPTDQAACTALPCDSVIKYDKTYDTMKAYDLAGAPLMSLTHQR